jgi:hypothetical protein
MQESEIKLLFQLREDLQALISKKRQIIADLELEITEIKSNCDLINSMISNASFTTAANLYDAESAATSKDENYQNLNYTEKIFSENQDLLAVIQFEDQKITIRFPNPQKASITQERYIEDFVKPCLVILKKIETQLNPQITKESIESIDYISTIILNNVSKFESFEFVVEKIKNLIPL